MVWFIGLVLVIHGIANPGGWPFILMGIYLLFFGDD